MRQGGVRWMRFSAWWSGTNSDHFFICVMLQSFAIETRELQTTNHDRRQKHHKFCGSNPVASCNIFALEVTVGDRAIIVRRRYHHEKLSVGGEDQDGRRNPARWEKQTF
jgi:hypothetical protein